MPTLMTCLTSSMLSALTDALMLVTPSLLWYWLASWLPFATLNFSPNSSLLVLLPGFISPSFLMIKITMEDSNKGKSRKCSQQLKPTMKRGSTDVA
ncbi:hypothetical protein Goarm_009235, partial [Gossypium armourianum]|nr:hypothetical protein [Gossypium armourianum]